MKILLPLIILFSFNSQAGLLIEPYVGTASVATTAEADGLDDDEGTSSTTSFGSRLGLSFTLLSAGIDYQIDGGDITRTTSSVFLGVDLPVMFKFWAEYMLSSDLTNDDFEDDDIDVDFVSGYSVGVGFTGLPLVSINLEFEASAYEYESAGFDIDLGVASTLLSVSFPINL